MSYDFSKIIDLENRVGFTIPVQDISTGTLELFDKTYHVIAILCDEKLSEDKIAKLNKMKKVIKVGIAHHRYAPEITKTVIYLKA